MLHALTNGKLADITVHLFSELMSLVVYRSAPLCSPPAISYDDNVIQRSSSEDNETHQVHSRPGANASRLAVGTELSQIITSVMKREKRVCWCRCGDNFTSLIHH